jgi:polyribonucleotide nucleotidyltransferase
VVATILSYDSENDPDILGLLAASTALTTSNIPWKGPVAAVRIGLIDNKFIINPILSEREKSQMDFVLTGLENNGEIITNMMEGGFEELDESLIFGAFNFAKPYLKKLIDFQKDIAEKIGKEKIVLKNTQIDHELEKEIKEFLGNKLETALYQKDKEERMNSISSLKEELMINLKEKHKEEDKTTYVNVFFEKEIDRIVHEKAIKEKKRPDGRKIDEVRTLECEVGILQRTHGSGVFCRGQTKALSILTLGAPGDQQILESMEYTGKKRFMHHYNFPPYSVGEIKPMRGPGRRDIGHGMLAEKALLPIIPSYEQFPYTIRVVTEILSSNGSSSMASVSSSSLALMDAGVPIKYPAAGIAMGLMSEIDENSKIIKYEILTDIQGPEDHYGDMDFKIAGTKKGISAIQMDVKIEGITEEILKKALEGGKKARSQILDVIEKTLPSPRANLSPFAPRILILQINPDKIRDVIGPGGKVINGIIDECGVSIDIEDTGKIFITADKEESAKKAFDWVSNITSEVKVGEIFQGKIVRILDFGAFAEILPGQDGLIHISQLASHHVGKVEDIVKVGDVVPVKVISIDEQGRINLSLKEAKK